MVLCVGRSPAGDQNFCTGKGGATSCFPAASSGHILKSVVAIVWVFEKVITKSSALSNKHFHSMINSPAHAVCSRASS